MERQTDTHTQTQTYSLTRHALGASRLPHYSINNKEEKTATKPSLALTRARNHNVRNYNCILNLVYVCENQVIIFTSLTN